MLLLKKSHCFITVRWTFMVPWFVAANINRNYVENYYKMSLCLEKKHDAFCLLVKTHGIDKFGSPGIAYRPQTSYHPTSEYQLRTRRVRLFKNQELHFTQHHQGSSVRSVQYKTNEKVTSRKLNKENRKAYYTRDLF